MASSHLGGKKKPWIKKKKLDIIGPRDGYNKAPKGLNKQIYIIKRGLII